MTSFMVAFTGTPRTAAPWTAASFRTCKTQMIDYKWERKKERKKANAFFFNFTSRKKIEPVRSCIKDILKKFQLQDEC